MRHEAQHWDRIRATVEMVRPMGNGLTGLTPVVTIQRLSDGQFLANGGASWAAGVATNNMVEVSSSNLPGLYSFAIPSGALTYLQGLAGYRFKITEATENLLEYVSVAGLRSEWDELTASHVVANTFGVGSLPPSAAAIADQVWDEDISGHTSASSAGRMLHIIMSLGHGNHRLRNPVFDSEGRMTECELRTFANTSDANSDSNALATFTMEMTYDAFGNLASLLSRN